MWDEYEWQQGAKVAAVMARIKRAVDTGEPTVALFQCDAVTLVNEIERRRATAATALAATSSTASRPTDAEYEAAERYGCGVG